MFVDRVLSAITDSNERAAALYRRHGFEDEGLMDERSAGSPVERGMSYAIR